MTNKIQIVIVDDDLAARNSIKLYLQHHPLYEVAADFQDGQAALRWLQENEVDILLCDMQMPAMDGLELLRLVRMHSPDIATVAISSFDDFRYTRGCIVEGVGDYLLKHDLTQQRLLEVLDAVRLRYHIQPDTRTLKNVTGYCFESPERFTAEQIEAMIDRHEICFDKSGLCPLVISPDYRCAAGVSWLEVRQDMCKAVCDIVAQILGSEYRYIFCLTKQHHILLLLSFFDQNSLLFVMNSVNNFCSRLKRTTLRLLDITLTIGVGTPQLALPQALEQARTMERSMETKLYLGGDRLFSSERCPVVSEQPVSLPRNLWSAFSFAVEQKDAHNALEALQEIFTFLRQQKACRKSVNAALRRITEQFFSCHLLDEAGRDELYRRLAQFEILDQTALDLKEQAFALLRSEPPQAALSSVVSRAQEFVREHYAQDISLQDCADFAGVSYTHLSRAFKNETGKRFVEFLNEVRLHAAKALLIRQNLSMKEIVDRTGFRSYNYFFKVFRESEGMTPSEFVAKNCSKN